MCILKFSLPPVCMCCILSCCLLAYSFIVQSAYSWNIIIICLSFISSVLFKIQDLWYEHASPLHSIPQSHFIPSCKPPSFINNFHCLYFPPSSSFYLPLHYFQIRQSCVNMCPNQLIFLFTIHFYNFLLLPSYFSNTSTFLTISILHLKAFKIICLFKMLQVSALYIAMFQTQFFNNCFLSV